ncbi:MAG: hypothetical protein R3B59_01245 [Dehalococcoidia bacterium]
MNETPHLDRLQADRLEAEGVHFVDLLARARLAHGAIETHQGNGVSWTSTRPRKDIRATILANGGPPVSERVISDAIDDLVRAGLLKVIRQGRTWAFFLRASAPDGRAYAIRAAEEMRAWRESARNVPVHTTQRAAATTMAGSEALLRPVESPNSVPAHTPSSSVVIEPPQQPSTASHSKPGAATPVEVAASERHAAIAAQLRSKGLSPRLASTVDALARLPDVGLESFHAANGRHVRGVWERIDYYGPETPDYLAEIVADVANILIGYPGGAPPCTCDQEVTETASTTTPTPPPAGTAPTASSSRPTPPAGDHRIVRRAVRAATVRLIRAAVRALTGYAR